jgi:uncharacterized protein DUF1990
MRVSTRVGPGRRISTALTWPLGIALTSWSYIWRITPMDRREAEGSLERDMPPALPEDVTLEGVQRPSDGRGPLFHRTYSATIKDPQIRADALMERVKADPNSVSPWSLARFRKLRGPESRMERGDEFLVHMPGPWDGPVRVVDMTATSFRFATLDGHLEAGQIEWRALQHDGELVFQIESWARPADLLSVAMHDTLLMAKEVQLHMWTSVLERVVSASGGRLSGRIDIDTHKVPADADFSAAEREQAGRPG